MSKKLQFSMIGLALVAATCFGVMGCGSSNSSITGNASAQTLPDKPGEGFNQDPTIALAALQAGNARYVAGTNGLLNRSIDRPLFLNTSQAPEAIIVSCADSRVAPELAFDQPWGQLFVVRVAGPVTQTFNAGSIEFATAVLGARLIVVLGHEGCGAVNGALGPALPPGNLANLVQLIIPAAQSIIGQPGDPQDNAVRANVNLQAAQLRNISVPIDDGVKAERLVIKKAVYHLASGEVEYLP